MYNGILNIYKEAGYTSHDVVAKLRGILHQKKIGHTGTLDPDAVGVLPVCLGKATKVCGMLTDQDKTYEAVLLLGVETDTQDISGKVLGGCPQKADKLSEDQVREVLAGFVGNSEQIPPMYSALKVQGQKLCDLARKGIQVERKPRKIHISELTILSIELPRVTFRVTCSKGTYIRTLCQDAGTKLGCGGCMEHLVRTRVGIFQVEDAWTLEQIQELMDRKSGLERTLQGEGQETGIDSILLAPDALFPYEICVVAGEYQKLIYNGNRFLLEHLQPGEGTFSQEDSRERDVKVYDSQRHFIGIYRYQTDGSFKPVRMFLDL